MSKATERNFLKMHTNKESWQAKSMNLNEIHGKNKETNKKNS